jgi:Arc/MetJ family transcription regulator
MKVRTTIMLDDDLLEEAQELTGITEKAAVVREGLKSLIARESARRLILLGGSEPGAMPIPRRRSAVE